MKTVVLIGSGHAHLEILKCLSHEVIQKNNCILISPEQSTYYSGLIPRYIMGEVNNSNISIESSAFAKAKGFRYVQGKVKSIDLFNKQLILDDDSLLKFDILSINIGGKSMNLPTQCPHKTIPIKPFNSFTNAWATVQRECSRCMNPTFVVLGGGAAAIEIATALKIRLIRNQAPKAMVHLVTKGSRIGENYNLSISAKLLKSLNAIGIMVHLNENINNIYEKYLVLSNGQKLSFDSVFSVLPTIAPDIEIIGSTVIQDPEGFIRVDDMLQVTKNVFALGDCSSMNLKSTLPKSGVIAVHQGRHVLKSILATLDNKLPEKFVPPKNQLNILITGDTKARLIWGNFSIENRFIYTLKKWIDSKYIKSFNDAIQF